MKLRLFVVMMLTILLGTMSGQSTNSGDINGIVTYNTGAAVSLESIFCISAASCLSTKITPRTGEIRMQDRSISLANIFRSE
jgi:hypothetical protein